MFTDILFDPLLPPGLIWAIGAIAFGAVVFAAWRRLVGWALRGAAVLVVIGALLNPSLQHETRAPLPDIVVVIHDDTASQNLPGRAQQSAAALVALRRQVEARGNTELREVILPDDPGNGGTLLAAGILSALAELPQARIAAVVTITDGQIHDLELPNHLVGIPAPLHVLLTGQESDWDRRLTISNAPSFGIIGEEILLQLRVDDQGPRPQALGETTQLDISIDGRAPERFTVPIGETLELPLTLPHGGMNVVQFTVPHAQDELTDRNNTAVVQINGVRDRLRVLLVSGEPHAGERTWRNLLKSDASVDLVHFTILRPPEKQDGVPVSQLSLIAFPTRELFLDKIDDFDLIIFDRYKKRGILPPHYLENVSEYVRNGGAVLMAAGPDFASADSLYFSALAEVLPAEPTARVLSQGFVPEVTDVGDRHPVTANLQNQNAPDWGRWLRLVETRTQRGHVVMSGAEGAPLLTLDRVGEGRVALLASDQAWLWHRGFEGGGPQAELLRRLAHWMMKEPELEEEALWATAVGQDMTITRRSLAPAETTPDLHEVEITAPDGTVSVLPLVEVSPGQFETRFAGPELGLYRLRQPGFEAVVALGPAAPREFVQTVATGDLMAPWVSATQGGVFKLSQGMPDLRNMRAGRPGAGRGWMGVLPRDAYVSANITVRPMLPVWLVLLTVMMLSLGAWLWEGRRV